MSKIYRASFSDEEDYNDFMEYFQDENDGAIITDYGRNGNTYWVEIDPTYLSRYASLFSDIETMFDGKVK